MECPQRPTSLDTNRHRVRAGREATEALLSAQVEADVRGLGSFGRQDDLFLQGAQFVLAEAEQKSSS